MVNFHLPGDAQFESFFPTITLRPPWPRIPVALLIKGTVREALGLPRDINLITLIAYWMSVNPTTEAARKGAGVYA